jgi:hypothetical protein
VGKKTIYGWALNKLSLKRELGAYYRLLTMTLNPLN